MEINLPSNFVFHSIIRLLICIALCKLSLPAFTQVSFRSTDTIFIQDGNSVPIPSKPYPSQIFVEKQKGWVSKVRVTLFDMSHDFPDGIDLLLVAPDMTNVIILSDVGGATDLSSVTVTLDDDAANYLPDRSTITSGTYKPTNVGTDIDMWPPDAPVVSGADVLSTFQGKDPNGIWRLYAVSDMDGTLGMIAGGWMLTLEVEKKPLQTRISDFNATYNPTRNVVDLAWQTTAELNTNRFVIERASNNSGWTTISETAAAGFSSSSMKYGYTDKDLEEGTYTYRVKLIMNDGTEQYSPSARVKVEEVSYGVYPNPARNFTFVVSDSKTAEEVTVILRDMYGNVLVQKTGSLSRTSPIRLDFQASYSGPHYLEIVSGNKSTAKVLHLVK